MKYVIRTDIEDDRPLISASELECAFSRLTNEPHSFLYIEPEQAINGITYLQSTYLQKTKGLFKKTVIAYFEIEMQEEKSNGDLYHCFYETSDSHEALKIIRSFFELQTVPDFSQWRRELFYKSNS